MPKRAENPMYYLGAMTVLAFLIQVTTGILLALYYRPIITEAYASVSSVMENVTHGSLLRSLHYYAGNAMILFVILHLVRIYFTAAYKKPRELNWLVGLALGLLVVFAGLSGYLLRWDERAVGATNIGLSLATSVPVIGPALSNIVRGTGLQDTLSRFYVFHIALIPALILLLFAVHIHMVRTHGLAESIHSNRKEEKTIPFFPHHLLSEICLALVLAGILFAISGVLPAELGREYDPLNPTRLVLEPEWYFMALYQFLKTKGILPIYGITATAGVAVILALVPFLDRSEERHPLARPFFTALGAVLVVEVVAMTLYGYSTPGLITSVYDPTALPLFGVVQAAAVAAIFIVYAQSRVFRERRERVREQ